MISGTRFPSFQYLEGAIRGADEPGGNFTVHAHFNTSKVRLEVELTDWREEGDDRISIPRRCD